MDELASRSATYATAAAVAAADKMGRDILVLNVGALTSITDYFVICTAASQRQVRAISEEVEERLRAKGVKPLRREGQRDARWVLLDFMDVVVHIFDTEARNYYQLERLWLDAAPVEWESQVARAGATASSRP